MDTDTNTAIDKEMKVIVFRLQQQDYGVDVNQVMSIERVENITPIPEVPIFVRGIINLRGVVTPIIDLRTRFNLEEQTQTEAVNKRVIIVNMEGIQIGIVVDSANDVIDISIDSIEPPPSIVSGIKKSYLRGVAKLDTKLLILLNLNKVLHADELKIINEIGTDYNGSN